MNKVNNFFFDNGAKIISTPKKMFTLDDNFQGEGRMNRGDGVLDMIEDELEFIEFSSKYLSAEERARLEFKAIALIMIKIKEKHC